MGYKFTTSELYLCDPDKNKECDKRGCGNECKHTTRPEYAKKCTFCESPGTHIAAVDMETADGEENRLFIYVCGSYIQLFDKQLPGLCTSIPINYCPMCGRHLNNEA